jgi:hypothetical protein
MAQRIQGQESKKDNNKSNTIMTYQDIAIQKDEKIRELVREKKELIVQNWMLVAVLMAMVAATSYALTGSI